MFDPTKVQSLSLPSTTLSASNMKSTDSERRNWSKRTSKGRTKDWWCEFKSLSCNRNMTSWQRVTEVGVHSTVGHNNNNTNISRNKIISPMTWTKWVIDLNFILVIFLTLQRFNLQHMPDVISNVQTMNLNRVDDFMDDERDEDPMLSHLSDNLNHQQTSNLLDLDHLTNDPMLSASSSNLHQQQCSTVDISSIDPIITNYGLLSMHHHTSCDNGSVDSILQSDTDSLISDIDMITWHKLQVGLHVKSCWIVQ